MGAGPTTEVVPSGVTTGVAPAAGVGPSGAAMGVGSATGVTSIGATGFVGKSSSGGSVGKTTLGGSGAHPARPLSPVVKRSCFDSDPIVYGKEKSLKSILISSCGKNNLE
jgi:hypothetical protein